MERSSVHTVEWAMAACCETGDFQRASTILREAIADGTVSAEDAAHIQADFTELYGTVLHTL